MLIQIREINQTESGNFKLELTFDRNQTFQVELINPHTANVEENFEWYFEEYINEPYIAETRIQREKQRLIDYGIGLFENLFKDREAYSLYKKGLDENGFEGLTFEFLSLEKSIDFQSVMWESLRDPNFKEEPLIAKGALFYRKSLKPIKLEARVKEHAAINLLIVTARPSEDNDVDYRTIQRPIVDIIENNNVRVNPYILRPGTFKALSDHLEHVGSGFYHMIHFDLHGAVMEYAELKKERKKEKIRFSYQTFGKSPQTFQIRYDRPDLKEFEGKKAFLFFETEQKGLAEPAAADEIAKLIRDARIPVCILNACQSAKQEGTSSETSLAKFLQDEGVNLVLAMRYSVSVSAATNLMSRFYRELFNNRPIGQAISFARSFLHKDKTRQANLGYSIDLEDWVLPVIYQREEVAFQLRERTKSEKKLNYQKKAKLPRLVPPRFGFIGRDLDILKVEKLLQDSVNHLLIRGMLGIGKSAFLKYLAKWWVTTNFRNIDNCIYLDATAMNLSLKNIVQTISDKVFVDYKDGIDEDGVDYRKNELLEQLKGKAYGIIIDNIFEFSDEAVIDFLFDIKGKSFVVYGSVNGEESLQPRTFKDSIYQLDGLDKDATYILAGKIIATDAKKDIQKLVNGPYKFEFEQLLKLLAGFPSAMEMILPFLKKMNPKELLEAFQEGTLPIEF